MKAVLSFLAVLFVAYINAEDCPSNSITECTHMSCSGGYVMACVNNICTCTPQTETTCTSNSQCQGMSTGGCQIFQTWQCVSGVCRCTWDFGGIGK
ncbi:serine protease inhibitor Cvsi-1-like [Ruditapes philippinarum]|uniref:serine protease inhibitor Cvsi-1-like n=1 Tax=Ruditapes philippinarum TaxID=129788 RepID=UPI00295B7137|nr:serine protease inhibitor Cvsi-1-like [Ruditapes philippinarum]